MDRGSSQPSDDTGAGGLPGSLTAADDSSSPTPAGHCCVRRLGPARPSTNTSTSTAVVPAVCRFRQPSCHSFAFLPAQRAVSPVRSSSSASAKLDLPDPFRPTTRCRPGPGVSPRRAGGPMPRKPATVRFPSQTATGSCDGAGVGIGLRSAVPSIAPATAVSLSTAATTRSTTPAGSPVASSLSNTVVSSASSIGPPLRTPWVRGNRIDPTSSRQRPAPPNAVGPRCAIRAAGLQECPPVLLRLGPETHASRVEVEWKGGCLLPGTKDLRRLGADRDHRRPSTVADATQTSRSRRARRGIARTPGAAGLLNGAATRSEEPNAARIRGAGPNRCGHRYRRVVPSDCGCHLRPARCG